METLQTWLTAHWGAILIVIGALIQVLNAATQIWANHPAAIKWLSWFVSCLSIVRSKGEPHDGPLGALKLPLLPEKPSGIVNGRCPPLGCLLLGLVATATLLGCGHYVPKICPSAQGKLSVALQDPPPWTPAQCTAAQTKRDLLRGFAAGLGWVAAGGAAALIPDTDLTRGSGWKLGWGVTSVASAVAAIVLGGLAVSAQKNLSTFCTDYTKHKIKLFASAPLLRMRGD